MINTQEQYERTRYWAERFRASIAVAKAMPYPDKLLQKAIIDSLSSMAKELEEECRAWESRAEL